MRIKNVFIDLDETILDFHKAEEVAITKTFIDQGISSTGELIYRYSSINQMLWKKLEKGEVTREEVLTDRFKILFSEFEIDCSANETRKIYEKHLKVGHFFIDGAPELLEKLYQKYDLYLASNGTASVQDGRIKSAGIAKYFKEIFISQRIGYNKPQSEFFDYCFSMIPGFSKKETIIIGDSLSSDILGGNNAGILTCWYNPAGKVCSKNVNVDFEVSHLNQIPDILTRIF